MRQLVNSLDNLVIEELKTPEADTPYQIPTPSGLGGAGLGPPGLSVATGLAGTGGLAGAGLGPSSMVTSGGFLNTMSPYYGSYQDASVPFPRTSGARFCSTGQYYSFENI